MTSPTPHWRNTAACLGEDPEVFYFEDPRSVETAKLVCRACPVQNECFKDAARNEDWWGIRAGLTGPTRRRVAQGQHYKTSPGHNAATEILDLTAQGWTAVNIAGYLNVSKRTVERHLERDRRKTRNAA